MAQVLQADVVDRSEQFGLRESAPQEDVVRRLFEALHEAKITYVVPRSYSALPGDVGKDLDLLVSDQDLTAFRRLTVEVLEGAGWSARGNRRDRRGLSIRGERLNSDDKALVIDVRTYVSIETSGLQKSVSGFSRKLFAADIERRVVYPDDTCPIWVPVARDEWLLLFKQAAMKDKPAYVDTLRRLAEEDAPLNEWLTRTSGVAFETLLTSLNSDTWMGYAGKLLKARASEGAGRATIWSENTRAAKIVLGDGMGLAPILYFSGPDGAGKTTSIDLVTDWMRENNIEHRKYYSMKIILRRITRHLVWLKRRKKHKEDTGVALTIDKIKPPSESERDRDDGSFFWRLRKHLALIVGVLDMHIGALMMLRHRVKGRVVLVETSPLDIFIKYHMPEFPVTEAILAPTLMKPTAGFLLDASPESIVARKAELSLEEITDYYARMEKVLKRSRMSDRYVRINSAEGLEVMQADLTAEISKVLG